MDKAIFEANLGFEKEDRPVIERMRPVFSPRDTTSELLLPEDQIMTRYRECLEKWRRKGWQIDHDKVRRLAEHKLFAIPSPARRAHGNWVVGAIPLLAAE